MSSARGAAGAVKPKLHNVNSIYAGKNQNAVKAPGSGKHGGLQSLGKTAAVVRRMPPPATLPSLRAESQGQDPNVALVPQGGTGWHKENTTANTQSSDPSGKSSVGQVGSALSGSVGCTVQSGVGPHGADLRPTWAKQPSAADLTAQSQLNASVAASARDFPSLAAATATSAKQTTQTLTDSLKPQKSGSWRAGGSSAVSKNDSDEPVSPPQIHSTGGYPAVTAPVRNVERLLPSRYYDASAAPPPPPTGSFQIPKQQSGTAHMSLPQSIVAVKEESRPQTQDGGLPQSSPAAASGALETSSTTFPSSVALPPPNYSQPPPSFPPVQQQPAQMRCSTSAQSVPNDVSHRCEQEGGAAPQKDGLGDGGYTQRAQATMFDDMRVGGHSTNNAVQQMSVMGRSNDVRNTPYGRRESFDSRDAAFEETSVRGAECDWHSAQYRTTDRDSGRNWAGVGSSPQDGRHILDSVSQNVYGRERDDDRQDVEREAAIERSRQKRHTVGQPMPQPDGEVRRSTYGSVRAMGAYEIEPTNDWDRTSVHESFNHQRLVDDGGMYRQEKILTQQRWGGRREDYGEGNRSGIRREDTEQAPKPEYRMLRRPESKESVELPQQFSQMIIDDEIQDEEEDDLQLTKLSRPAAKIIKRVAPGSAAAPQSQAEGAGGMQSMPTPQSSQPPSRSSPSLLPQRTSAQNGPPEKRMPEHRNQGHNQRTRRYDGVLGEPSKQNSANQGRNVQTAGRGARLQDEGIVPMRETSQATTPAVTIAPPPTDNIWEKRAEERESAERERTAAQRDAVYQMRLQQQFPAVGEQTGGMGAYVDGMNGRDESMSNAVGRDTVQKNDSTMSKQRSNRRRNQNWTDGGYGGAYGQADGNDYYGQEDEEYNGALFRGQREFVNSRVSANHRTGRGISLSGTRGGRGYMRSGFGGMRRGASLPHQPAGQHATRQQSTHYNERSQRRSKRRDEQPFEEEDNFANMGEFHVEDTYECMPQAVTMTPHEQVPIEADDDCGKTAASGERRGSRQTRSQRGPGGHRNTQQLYQPRQQLHDEYGRSGRGGRLGSSRGGSARRSNDARYASTNQNPPERGKRKKEMNIREEEIGRELRGEEEGKVQQQNVRAENNNYRRGSGRRGSQQVRHRHVSPLLQNNSQTTTANASERSSQLKSPVTSEDHEEWATASESSDVADKQRSKRRVVAASKYASGQRRVPRSNANGQRREGNAASNNNGSAPGRTGTSSKNGKPASTTSHAAARGAQPPSLKEEAGQVVRGEGAAKRDACKDGLAGVDINNAGVIVIDDRPDEQHGDDSIDNGDFEEVLSKKSKRLRQQQINEQIEAEERRKLKEKEKQEKRKAKAHSRKMEKKMGTKEDRTAITNGDANLVNGTSEATLKVDSRNATVTRPKAEMAASNAQNTLNTTVWNSNIVKEHSVRQSSPPLENHPVIPSPIARPTPKTSITSTTAASSAVKKGVEVWAGPDDEQRLTTSKKLDDAASSAKKNSVEFAASFNSPSSRAESTQYDFTFDPSLQDESQPLCAKGNSTSNTAEKAASNASTSVGRAPTAPSQPSPLNSTTTLVANDDERLKLRLDKVKDFWPGQQQFSNSLLVTTSENGPIAPLVSDKSNTAANGATSSLSHAPNVAKVRPQPQTNEQTTAAPLKEAASCVSSAPSLPPPSPIACIPPGAYLQSLSQVPPPAALTHYSMIFGEPYNPHSTASSPAQTLFGTGMSVSQAPASRSRPGSFIEQSQLFIHPPPSGTTPSSLTWSNGNPQIELLAGINATPPLPSQPGNAVQRFQFSSQPRSGSAFSARPPMLNGSAKLLGAPPPHPHQMPPPLHPPHSFMGPPPDFISLQGTTLGAVGSQRSSELTTQSSASGALSRSAVGVLGQLPPPHLQQQLNFPTQSQSGFTLTATGSFNQAPPMHAFTAPPPPLRYPPVVPTLPNEATGVIAAAWTKPSVNAYPLKYTNGGAQATTSMGPSNGRSAPPIDRWAVPVGVPPQYASALVFQSAVVGKDSADVLQSNIERFPSQRCVSAQRASSADENARASSVSSVTASAAGDSLDNSNQQKKAAKV
uniref:BAT2 N-terminal domain-containing protein n=1 Tax=Parascaris univalens TaxID=6257 RepID=A0A915AIU9_PARUN